MFLNYQENTSDVQHHPKRSFFSLAILVSCGAAIAALTLLLILASLHSEKAAPHLANLVEQNIHLSGVTNPVTAVLLNFRSYDTLLEIAVFLIVALAMVPDVSKDTRKWMRVEPLPHARPVQQGLVAWVVPLGFLVGGYLLWTGAHAPGGAFQAGAVIAAAGVALSLVGQHTFIWSAASIRWLLSLGLIFFMAASLAGFILTGTILKFPVASAGVIILLVESAVTLSIAIILLLLYTTVATTEDEKERLK